MWRASLIVGMVVRKYWLARKWRKEDENDASLHVPVFLDL
jgi:hypothetical protein